MIKQLKNQPIKHIWWCVLIFNITGQLFDKTSATVTIQKSAYQNVVIEIKDYVPVDRCKQILTELEHTLIGASQFLFTALDGRAYFGNFVIILPSSWPETTCLPANRTMHTSIGERSDITVTVPNQIDGNAMWTQQSRGCGNPGDQVYISHTSVHRQSAGREFVREWAKYRYGVFDEIGYLNDPIYPKCYRTDRKQITGCSDVNLKDNGICDDLNGTMNMSDVIDPMARSSIMFAGEQPNILMFCDEGTHNRYAPTKHNQMCNRQSTLDVILKHADFEPSNLLSIGTSSIIFNTSPIFTYKKRRLTRYLLVIDETKDSLIRESWSFLRTAIRQWVVFDLPQNTEVGIILANDKGSTKKFQISPLKQQPNRDFIAAFIPFSASDSLRPACINCAVKEAIEMLDERAKQQGPASQVIVIIGPGMDFNTDVKILGQLSKRSGIRLATINYPGIVRRQELDPLAEETDGLAQTVYELKQNSEKSFLTTYFQLSNAFYHILTTYYEGNTLDLPLEIHRKELIDVADDQVITKRSSRPISAAFMLDKSMGAPSSFYIYTHSAEHPLIQSAKLTSPSGISRSTRSENRLIVKQLSVSAAIEETGTWTYTIDRVNGNPQPHYVQVMATARSFDSPVIRAKSWIHRTKSGPLILFAEVKMGELPVVGALVEVVVTRPGGECNAVNNCEEKLLLLDTGSGDPDVIKGDGIYTRYFNYETTGPGAYRFEITVTDNGNTAYSLPETYKRPTVNNDTTSSVQVKCCGSFVLSPAKQTLASFQRVLPAMMAFTTQKDVDGFKDAGNRKFGRIGDLRAEVLDGLKVRFTWTSPDLGGLNVARYEVKYAFELVDIIDKFETAAILWDGEQPFAFTIGDDTSFTMNLTHRPRLLERVVYVAIRSYSVLSKDAEPSLMSNVVRIFVRRPVDNTTPITSIHRVTDSSGRFFPFLFDDTDGTGSDGTYPGFNRSMFAPNLSDSLRLGWESIIPIIVGIILVMAIVFIYCFICYRKRSRNRQDNDNPKKKFNSKLPPIQSVSDQFDTTGSAPVLDDTQRMSFAPVHSINLDQSQQTGLRIDSCGYPIGTVGTLVDIPDPHTIGLPIYGSEDDLTKKRFSITGTGTTVNEQLEQQEQQDQQLIERLKIIGNGLNVISTSNSNSNTNTITRNGRTLSPYESWTASQLLHEHERRHSPLDDLMNQRNCLGPPSIPPPLDIPYIGNGFGNGFDRISLSGCINGAPPVPPLPYTTNTTNTGYSAPLNYTFYGGNGAPTGSTSVFTTSTSSIPGHNRYGAQAPMQQTQSNQQQQLHHQQSQLQSQNSLIGGRNTSTVGNTVNGSVQFNSSLLGSMNSVNSAEKKKTRNITMV